MKVYRDLSNIKSKESRGRRITLAGLGVLFLGLLASFTPNWFPPDEPAANALIEFLKMYWAYISFGALALGFIASNIGSYYINRFAARRWPETKQIARPDELLERSLKGFDNKYSLFLWSLSQTAYLMVGPPGVFVFNVKGDKGTVSVEGDHWKEAFSIGRIFTSFTREGLGNPAREVHEEEQKVRDLLLQGQTSGELDVDAAAVPVQGAVVFVNPAVNLNAVNPSVPVMETGDLKRFIRDNKERALSNDEVRDLTEFLRDRGTISTEE